jgi:DNA-binding transcriptional regulator YiaG
VRRPAAKLSHEDAVEIRELCEVHLQCDVAKLFRVHAATVSRARRSLTWRETDDQLASRTLRPAAKISLSDVEAIRRLSGTLRHSDLAAMFGVHRATIWKIVSGRSWRDLP